MKSAIILFSIIITLVSCSEPLVEKIEATYPNNKPKAISYFKPIDGKEVKVQEKLFYENGNVKMEGEIKDGKRIGMWKSYYEDGSLWSKGEFVNGERNGYGENYYPNGKMREEGDYKDGKQVGKWKYYNEHGVLVEERMK